MSGSTAITKSRHFVSRSVSLAHEITFEPTIGAQVYKVKTFLTKMSSYPWIFTMFAIYITGSQEGVGNLPACAAHSISKLRILNGAILEY